jgi:hypothetical protein
MAVADQESKESLLYAENAGESSAADKLWTSGAKVGADEAPAQQGGRANNALLAAADGDTAFPTKSMWEIPRLCRGGSKS